MPRDVTKRFIQAVVPEGTTRHGLVIGIDKHVDERLDLRCAVADARAVHALMVDSECGCFPHENVQLLLDSEATTDRIFRELARFRKRVAANDVVWIYYAGHAAVDEEAYWVTHDTDVDDLFATALASNRINSALAQLRAKNIVFILDCCHAAAMAFVKNSTRAIVTASDLFRRFRGHGRITLAASDGKQKSVELPDVGHGAFTYFLEKGLRGDADGDNDGIVTLDELWSYLQHKVAEASRRAGNPQRPMLSGSMTHDVALTLNSVLMAKKQGLMNRIEKITGVRLHQLTADEAGFCAEIVARGPRTELERHLIDSLGELAAGQHTELQFRRLVQANMQVANRKARLLSSQVAYTTQYAGVADPRNKAEAAKAREVAAITARENSLRHSDEELLAWLYREARKEAAEAQEEMVKAREEAAESREEAAIEVREEETVKVREEVAEREESVEAQGEAAIEVREVETVKAREEVAAREDAAEAQEEAAIEAQGEAAEAQGEAAEAQEEAAVKAQGETAEARGEAAAEAQGEAAEARGEAAVKAQGEAAEARGEAAAEAQGEAAEAQGEAAEAQEEAAVKAQREAAEAREEAAVEARAEAAEAQEEAAVKAQREAAEARGKAPVKVREEEAAEARAMWFWYVNARATRLKASVKAQGEPEAPEKAAVIASAETESVGSMSKQSSESALETETSSGGYAAAVVMGKEVPPSNAELTKTVVLLGVIAGILGCTMIWYAVTGRQANALFLPMLLILLLVKSVSGIRSPTRTAQVSNILPTRLTTPPRLGSALGDARTQLAQHAFAAASMLGSVDSAAAPPVIPSSVGPRSMIGRWEVVRRLGSGGMADVYLARGRGDGFEKLVAIKVMHSQFARNQRFVESFLYEARLTARIHHPNVVAIQDLGKIGDDYVMVMEYVEGVDLERLLASARAGQRSVPLAVALGILCRICDGLDAAHGATAPNGTPLGIVHRDVKSANVLVSRNGSVKVIDFGVARAAKTLHFTMPDETGGTPAMMAPEQRVGDQVDVRADVYSVAAIGYELVTGQAVNLDLASLDHLGIENWPHLPLPSSLRPGLPVELDEILLHALAFERERRPANCAVFGALCENVMRQYDLVVSDQDIAHWVEGEREPRSLAL